MVNTAHRLLAMPNIYRVWI